MTDYDGTTYTPSVMDEVLFLPDQDVHEPVATDDAAIADMRAVEDPYSPEAQAPMLVRTAHGALDFFNDVKEDVESYLAQDKPLPSVPAPKLDAIRTRELGSDHWRARTAVVTTASGPQRIADDSKRRRRILVVNVGAQPAYLSGRSPMVGVTSPAPNQITLPVSAAGTWLAIPFQTRGEIWATSTDALIQTIEEYDMED